MILQLVKTIERSSSKIEFLVILTRRSLHSSRFMENCGFRTLNLFILRIGQVGLLHNFYMARQKEVHRYIDTCQNLFILIKWSSCYHFCFKYTYAEFLTWCTVIVLFLNCGISLWVIAYTLKYFEKYTIRLSCKTLFEDLLKFAITGQGKQLFTTCVSRMRTRELSLRLYLSIAVV